jgi:hypothetical protein
MHSAHLLSASLAYSISQRPYGLLVRKPGIAPRQSTA